METEPRAAPSDREANHPRRRARSPAYIARVLGGFPERWPTWRVTVVTAAAFVPLFAGIYTTYFVAAGGGPVALGVLCGATSSWLVLLAIVAPRGGIDQARRVAWRLRMHGHADHPWTRDRRWDPRGASELVLGRDAIPSAMVGAWAASTFVLMFMNRDMPVLRSAGHLGLAGLSSLWLWRLYRRLTAGRVHVRYTRFPYPTGSPVELCLGVDDGSPDITDAVVHLVCEQPWLTDGSVAAPSWILEPRPIGQRDGVPLHLGPGSDVVLVFDVPAGAPPTCSDPLARYAWRLVVAGTTQIGPVHVRLPVPIYRAASDSETQDPATAGRP